MIVLAVYLVSQAGIENISFTLSTTQLDFWASIPVMFAAIALVAPFVMKGLGRFKADED